MLEDERLGFLEGQLSEAVMPIWAEYREAENGDGNGFHSAVDVSLKKKCAEGF